MSNRDLYNKTNHFKKNYNITLNNNKFINNPHLSNMDLHNKTNLFKKNNNKIRNNNKCISNPHLNPKNKIKKQRREVFKMTQIIKNRLEKLDSLIGNFHYRISLVRFSSPQNFVPNKLSV